jgi:hypothetical protein
LRQSNSESAFLDKKKSRARSQPGKLDPRIYPSWWGEDYAESPAKAQKAPEPVVPKHQRPESSLEKGMREIRETASKLDKNLSRFK